MPKPTLLYLGTADPRINKLRPLASALAECGCDYLEFNGLNHATSGLGDGADGGEQTTSAITDWLTHSLRWV